MDERVEVRRAVIDDVEAMVDLMAVVAEEGRWLGTEAGFDKEERAARFSARLSEPAAASFVAVVPGDGVIGNLVISRADYGVAELGMLVAREWRGRGVGTKLLVAAFDWARQAGAHKVALQCWPHNEAALALYERFGFEREGYLRRHYARQNGELWDTVVMGALLDGVAGPAEDGPGPPTFSGR